MKKIHILSFLVIFFFAGIPISFCQNNITITGKVADTDNTLLEGASVVLKGTQNGVLVKADGTYSIQAPANGTLIFTFLGHVTQEIPIRSRTVIDVTLAVAEDKDLDEVVIVGYKSVIRKDITGSVSSINTDDLQDIPAPSLINLLAGKAAGVQSVVRSGLPGGSGGGLVIRGNTSLSASSDVNGLSNPLYIVDGVPVSLQDIAGF